MIKNVKFWIIIIIITFKCLACKKTATSPPNLNGKLQEELNKKINELKLNRTTSCTKELLIRANEIVDSTLIEEAKNTRGTVTDKPPKPIKPPKPAIILPKDSLKLVPIVDE